MHSGYVSMGVCGRENPSNIRVSVLEKPGSSVLGLSRCNPVPLFLKATNFSNIRPWGCQLFTWKGSVRMDTSLALPHHSRRLY